MAGTLKRMTRIVRAELGQVISRLEDPPKIVGQMVIDMECALDSAIAETSRAVANHRLMERRLAGGRDRAQDLERRAEDAVRAGRDEEARSLLDAKLATDQAVERQATVVKEAGIVSDDLKKQLSVLRGKLEDARARGPALADRRVFAARNRSRHEGPEAFTTEPFSAYDRMIDEVERQEIAADVYDEILETPARDDHEQLARNVAWKRNLRRCAKKRSRNRGIR